MESRTAGPSSPDPDAIEFVRFCYRRRRVGWPELYDEMCAVASRGLFRGLGPDELAGLGIGFSLFDMPALAGLAAGIIGEEQARRRPVAVRIAAEPVPVMAGPQDAANSGDSPETERSADPVERTTDVPIRMNPVPAAV